MTKKVPRFVSELHLLRPTLEAMTDSTQTWAAGWYNDPDRVGTLRYYNGTEWEDKYAPAGAQTGTTSDNGNVITAGLLFAILLPIVGFIIGLTQINKKGGLLVVVVSILAGIIWYAIYTENFANDASYSY